MLSETLGVKSIKEVGRKKKVSIKGVLNKDELAEVYNCDIKKGRRRRSSVPNFQTVQPSVKAVDFQEAQIEDLLPDITQQQEKQGSLKRPQSSHNFIEAVRRVSHVEPNNVVIIPKNRSSNPCNLGNRETTPAGYEPEDSLCRSSSASRPSQLQLNGGARRRSALDKPTFMPQNVQIPEQEPATGYEPENSLRRVRKSNNHRKFPDQDLTHRQRGMVSTNQIPPPTPNLDVHFFIADESDSEHGSNSPTTPQAAQRKPVFTLSIPEDEAVKGGCPPTTASPRYRRKVSSTSLAFRTEAYDASPQSTFNFQSMPTRSRKTSLDTQIAKHSVPSFSAYGGSKSSPRSLSGVKLNEFEARTAKADKSPLDIRAKKYWEWYILSASSSWENFNADGYYCY